MTSLTKILKIPFSRKPYQNKMCLVSKNKTKENKTSDIPFKKNENLVLKLLTKKT